MKAIMYDSYGGPDTVELRDGDVPAIADDQVLVKMHATSVNPLDWHFLTGTPYVMRAVSGVRGPKQHTPGADIAGTVEEVGSSVTRFAPGDEVWGGAIGAFAEYVAVREKYLVPKPTTVDFEHAAAAPVAALTALQSLRDYAKVQAGQRVLINGASGGVGTYAVQIAKSFGAEVTGVCSGRNVELVRSLGADHVIDYTADDFTTAGVRYDAIIDNIGNHGPIACRRALTRRGTYVMVGAPKRGRVLGPIKGLLRAKLLSPFVSQKMRSFVAEITAADLAVVNDLLDDGSVTSVIDRTYPLSEAAAALAYLETGRARGKIIITP